MQLMGRYTVGMKNILGPTSVVDLSIPQLKMLLENSDNPRKHLFFIPILMELAAPEEVFSELESLAAKPADDPVAGDASLFLQLYQRGSASLTSQQIRDVERYGWIGRLALSHDRTDSDPLRRAVVRSAVQTFVVLIVFVLGMLAALGTGLVLFIIAIVLWNKKRLQPRLIVPADPGASLLQAFAIFITGMIGLPALTQWLLPGYQLAASLLSFPVVVIALLWPSICGSKWRDIRAAIGWHRGRGVFREMGAGILGYLTGLPLLALALIPVMILSRFTGTVPAHPIVNEISGNPITLIFILGLACIWAPVIEESFFRGMLFGYFRRRLHWSVAGISTGFLFAVIHPQGWIAVPVLAAIGFTLSAIREWRGSIIASMTAHALNNGVVLMLAILMLT